MSKDNDRIESSQTSSELTSNTNDAARTIFARLSVMMFLQYFVQGAYQPVASVYLRDALGFTSEQIGYFGAALSVGPMFAPFIIGQLVDRYFSTERVMAACHLLGGVLMLALFTQTEPIIVIAIGTIYSVLYVPTMMLSNALAFRHLKNSDRQFPIVRAFGTIGFMVPAFLVESWWLSGLEGTELDKARAIVFVFSGAVGIAMGLYCLSLPHTPPQPSQARKYAPGAVLGMLRQRHFLVLIMSSFFIAIAHKFFVVWNSPFLREILNSGGVKGAYEQRISAIGQFCEIGVMASLGFFIATFGFKRTMLIGATAYLVRCLILGLVFTIDPPFAGKMAMAVAGQALHGFCFGCFFAAAYMYVDRIAPADVKGSMQTFYGTFVVALGFFFGGLVSGWIGRAFSDADGKVQDWTSLWMSCAALSAICVVSFAITFPSRLPTPETE